MTTPDRLNTGPTPFSAVNALLQRLLDEVRSTLGAGIVGLYLYGSLSSGDFDPLSSDVDFLVVTRDALSEAELAALEAMHRRIAASGLPRATKLEGWYVPRAAVRRFDPNNARHPTIGVDWEFGLGEYRSDWIIQLHIVREHGVVLWGPPPATLIDPVTAAELRRATIDTTLGYWAAQLEGPEPEWLRTREYQAFAILTMCRILYTLEAGKIASKPVAADWARAHLPSQWRPLVDRALDWRHDTQPDDMTEMLSFIHYTVERCQQARSATT